MCLFANPLQMNCKYIANPTSQIVVHLQIVSGAATPVLSETSLVNAEMRVSDIRRILGVATTQGLAGFNQMSSPPHFLPRCSKNNFLIRVNIFKLSSAATT